MADWLHRLAVRFHIWAICRAARRSGLDIGKVRDFANRIVPPCVDDVLGAVSYHQSETEVLSARLARRYDLGMALNEAANRAIEAKKAERTENEVPRLSGSQLAALEFQKKYLQGVVNRS